MVSATSRKPERKHAQAFLGALLLCGVCDAYDQEGRAHLVSFLGALLLCGVCDNQKRIAQGASPGF